MKCPECNKELKSYYHDISYGDNKKEYARNYYNCEEDDTWILVEIPKNKNLA